MKTLILTSSASLVLDKIIEYLPKPAAELSVAFVPTASDLHENSPWVTLDREKLVELGFQVVDVDIKNKSAKELESALDKDVLFFAGGNTFYLLQELQKSNALDVIRNLVQRGRIYIGSSAGSAIAAPSIELLKHVDHPEKAPQLKGFDALGLTQITPLIHFGNEKFLDRYLKDFTDIYQTKNKYVCLRDDQALIIRDSSYQLI